MPSTRRTSAKPAKGGGIPFVLGGGGEGDVRGEMEREGGRGQIKEDVGGGKVGRGG